MLLNYRILIIYFYFGSLSNISKMVKIIPVIINFLLWCSSKHTADTQMNLNWYNNDHDGNEKPWDFNVSQILSWLYMASILRSSCEQICISFSTPPPQPSEIFASNEKNHKLKMLFQSVLLSSHQLDFLCHISLIQLTLKYCCRK